MTKTSNLNLITKKICELFEYTIPGEWGIEGDPENDIPVLRSTNFTNEGRIDYSNLAFRKIDPKRLALRLVNKGTILIEKSGGSPSQPAGRVVYCDEDFNGSASNFIEIAKTNNLFCPKYVFFLLHHLYQIGLVLKYQQQTTGIINFKLEQYKNEEVLLPRDRKEQTQIAAILSTIDRAIEQTEAIIAKQQRIKTGLMQDLLTKGIDEDGNVRSEATHKFKDSPLGRIPVEWEVEKLDSLLIEKRYGISTSLSEDPIGIPVLRMNNLVKGEIDFTDLKYSEREDARKLTLDDGDVLFNRTNSIDYVGRTAIYRYSGKPVSFASYLVRLVPDNARLCPEYLNLCLNDGENQIRVKQFATIGVQQANVNPTNLGTLLLAIPQKITEQKQIIEDISASIDCQRGTNTNLRKLQSLKIGLMQDLLTGNVRVTALLNDQETANI